MAKFALVLLACGLLVAANAVPAKHHGPRLHRNPRKSYDTLIVGGEDAEEGELPYQISLREQNFHFCGGAIISVNGTQVVITASHCVEDNVYPEDYNVVAGDLKQSDRTGHEQRRRVTRIIMHEDYDWITNFADIALLEIDQPFDLNEYVQTIALPESMQESTGDIVVSGWGRLYTGGPTPDILQKVTLPIVDDATCEEAYRDQEPIYPSFLCAGFLGVGGKDSCQGDSGGPMVTVGVNGTGKYLAAVVSWGYGCGLPNYPGVNTETSHYITWINDNVRKL